MAKLHLTVVTPEKEIFSSEVDEVYLTTTQGEIGILPHHANLMASVIPGELRVKNEGKIIPMATGGGLVQMSNNNLVIAIDSAEKVEDISEKEAEEARERAQKALEQTLSDEEYAVALATLEKALAKLKVKRRHSRV